MSTSLPSADGYAIGQRDRALVLDLLAAQREAQTLDLADHPAFDIPSSDWTAAWNGLVRDGLAHGDRLGRWDAITRVGLAQHAQALRATQDIADRLGIELPSLTTAFARRREIFGAVA